LGKGNYEICRSIGHYQALKGVPKALALFLRLGNPLFTLMRAPRMWKQIHDHGWLEVSSAEPYSGCIRLYDFKTPHIAFCFSMMGYCEGIIEACHLKTIRMIQQKCVTSGDPYCEFYGKWSE